MWNSLPNDVVHAESTNTFKSRFDKFWSNQAIIYDYRAEIQGTGSRSVTTNFLVIVSQYCIIVMMMIVFCR